MAKNAAFRPERPLSPGTTVADVMIMRYAGEGATAIVYRGRRYEQNVALKIGTASAASERTGHRFRNEARVAATLNHPNIVRPLEAGILEHPKELEGRMYLVSDFADGASLSEVVGEHPFGLPDLRVRRIAAQLASAMQEMHKRGVVHRDIKPGNIILGDDDLVHVIDFGIAYAIGQGGVPKTRDVTLQGAAPGTTRYMSPEQLKHDKVTPAFDIFSFGATLYELISGSPLDNEILERELFMHRLSASWAPSPLAESTPEDLVSLVHQCLRRDPDSRPTASEVLATLSDDDGNVTVQLPRENSVPPPVVVEGSRPDGDETMLQLARNEVAVPAVNRPHTKQTLDSRRAIPIPNAVAERVPETTATPPRQTTRNWVLVVAVVFLFTVAGTWIALSNRSHETRQEGSTAPASVIEKDPPRQEPGNKEVRNFKPDVHGPSESALQETPQPLPPEAEPVAEPTPPVQSHASKKAEMKPRTKKKRERPRSTVADAPSNSNDCIKTRNSAKRALESGRLAEALKMTKKRSCWKGHERKRTYVRVSALHELGNFAACAREGKGSTHPSTRALADLCSRK